MTAERKTEEASERRTRRASKRGGERAAMPGSVLLENPRTGEARRLRTGFSWTLFLFSGVLGVPLFLRGLHRWGLAFVGLWAIDALVVWLSVGAVRALAEAALFCAFLGLQFWLGFRGNALTAKTYMARGWSPVR